MWRISITKMIYAFGYTFVIAAVWISGYVMLRDQDQIKVEGIKVS